MGNIIEMVDLYERRIHRLEQELEQIRQERDKACNQRDNAGKAMRTVISEVRATTLRDAHLQATREIEGLRAEVQHLVAVNGEIDTSVWLARQERDDARAAARQIVAEVRAVDPGFPCVPYWLRTWPWLEDKHD